MNKTQIAKIDQPCGRCNGTGRMAPPIWRFLPIQYRKDSFWIVLVFQVLASIFAALLLFFEFGKTQMAGVLVGMAVLTAVLALISYGDEVSV